MELHNRKHEKRIVSDNAIVEYADKRVKHNIKLQKLHMHSHFVDGELKYQVVLSYN